MGWTSSLQFSAVEANYLTNTICQSQAELISKKKKIEKELEENDYPSNKERWKWADIGH